LPNGFVKVRGIKTQIVVALAGSFCQKPQWALAGRRVAYDPVILTCVLITGAVSSMSTKILELQ
jgi:hypothetical protein